MSRTDFVPLVLAGALSLPLTGCQTFTVTEWSSCVDDPDYCDQHVRISFHNAGRMEELVDFPVPIRLTANEIDYSLYSDDGRELVFFESDGSATIDHDIEAWNPGGESLVWVRIDSIKADSNDGHIYLYQGDQAVDNPPRPAQVWRNGYEGVYHFNLAAAPGTLIDSSGHERHGDIFGPVTESEAPATIGPAAAFPGPPPPGAPDPPDDAYIAIDGGPAFQSADNAAKTVELWLHSGPAPLPNRGYGLFDNLNAGCQGFAVAVLGDGVSQANMSEDGKGCQNNAVNSPVAGVWVEPERRYYIVAEARRPQPGTIQACLKVREVTAPGVGENVSDACGPVASYMFSSLHELPAIIGLDNNEAPSRMLQGTIDELRISTGTRSSAWLDAQFAAMAGDFVIVEPGVSAFKTDR